MLSAVFIFSSENEIFKENIFILQYHSKSLLAGIARAHDLIKSKNGFFYKRNRPKSEI